MPRTCALQMRYIEKNKKNNALSIILNALLSLNSIQSDFGNYLSTYLDHLFLNKSPTC